MRRSAYGLDTPRDTELGLCNLTNAEWFDLPHQSNHMTKLTVLNVQARELCWRCPIRRRCLAEFEQLPAERRALHIAGGYVWDTHGEQVAL